jgi:hypothetical protein
LVTCEAAVYVVYKLSNGPAVIMFGDIPTAMESADLYLLEFERGYSKTKLHNQVVLRLVGRNRFTSRVFNFKRVSRVRSKLRIRDLIKARLSQSARRVLNMLQLDRELDSRLGQT